MNIVGNAFDQMKELRLHYKIIKWKQISRNWLVPNETPKFNVFRAAALDAARISYCVRL